MPQTPNPHRMGAPLVYVYPITTTPTGATQPTPLSLDNVTLLGVTLATTIPETTGSQKTLDILATGSQGFIGSFTVAQTGIAFQAQSIGAEAPIPGAHLAYLAASNDWADFRGTLKIIYLPFSSV